MSTGPSSSVVLLLLFVGAFLRRIGWQVDIYERSSIELIGRGVGIFATHLELLEALDKCGAGTVGPAFPRNAHDAIGTNGTEFTVGIGGTADMDRCVASAVPLLTHSRHR
jgi:hypothetical protein